MTSQKISDEKKSAGGLSARVGQDLWPRVVSGVVMAAVALGAVAAGHVALAVLASVVLSVAAWEWGRIVRDNGFDAAAVVQALTSIGAIALAATGRLPFAGLVALVGTLVAGALGFSRGHTVLSALGVAVSALAGTALVALRDDKTYGLAAVLFVCFAVACTDIGAYFSGRLIGGPKLWPAVSPNKTWAGLGGAVVAAAAVGAVTATLVGTATLSHLAILGAAFAIVAQTGDLGESALKRHFGTKDASTLIPGHGGVMDRIDGLVAVLVVIALAIFLTRAAEPARALLTW